MLYHRIILFIILIIYSLPAFPQEGTVPLLYNGKVAVDNELRSRTLKRTEPISLPFIETFHYYEESALPSDEWWTDAHVYINNHFSNNHYNKGIATFDAIDQYGKPYTDINPWEQKICDSLTSYFIDLSDYNPGDSLYLSFDYLAGGLGFKPKASDSLIVYFRDSVNGWQKVDFINDPVINYWRTKLIPIRNPSYFYGQFQFRIVNRGTLGFSGSQWHIDNVLLDAGRHYLDLKANNLAFNNSPSSFFRDFTSMPWKHYNTDRNAFTNDSLFYSIFFHHNIEAITTTTVDYSASVSGGPTLASGSMPVEIYESETKRAGFPNINPSVIPEPAGSSASLDLVYSLAPLPDDRFEWDNTIVRKNVFSNYMSYDDGNAEQAYFLNLSPGLRGEVAVEYACYVPDTLAAIMIQFVPQVPHGEDKEFFIRVYKEIESGGSGSELIYEQGGNFPVYTTDNHGLVLYELDELVPLPTGIFYLSIMMPASGLSDSLMIGLDVHRQGGNHRYYNVLDIWESSLIEGALMVRPVFSGTPLSHDELPILPPAYTLYPNPADKHLYLQSWQPSENLSYSIYDISGRPVDEGIYSDEGIDVQAFPPGIYILSLQNSQGAKWTDRFIRP